HTSFSRDWSSDVCSSALNRARAGHAVPGTDAAAPRCGPAALSGATARAGRFLEPPSTGSRAMNQSSQREVVIVSGVRTAVGDFGGALKDFSPTRLAATVLREATARAGVGAEDVHHVVFGNVIHTEPRDMYLARVAAIDGGLAHSVPALTLNRLCGSGLQAVVSAAQAILLGEADIAVAGGAEVMSRAPYASTAMRWGARMGDAKMFDMMLGALHDPFHEVHMGITAENIAKK